MSNLFSGFTTEGMEKTKDVLGGFSLFESDIYEAEIKLAYAGSSTKSKAQSITVHLDIGGREYRETIWVTNGNNENFSVRDGVKSPLPGYVTIDDLCLLATGYPLPNQTMEEKTVPLYDFEAKENRNQNVQVITSILGKKVRVGIQKVEDDKTKLNEATKKYEPTGETRELNTLAKVFHFDTKKTTAEFREGKEATFHDAWQKKWKDQVYKKAKGAAGKEGRPGAARPQQGETKSGGASLFSKG